jgi:biopolymer transport protein ExbB
MSGVASLVRRKNYAEALHECLATGVPVGRVMHSALLRHQASRDELRQIVQEAGQMEVPKLERNLSVIYGIAHAAPLCGLLGTIISLLDSFTQLTQSTTAATPVQLAAGIYSSLTASAFGLAVAIPALLFYLLLSAKVRHLMNDLERAGIEIVNLLMDARQDNSILSFSSAAGAAAVPQSMLTSAGSTPELKVVKTNRTRAAKSV